MITIPLANINQASAMARALLARRLLAMEGPPCPHEWEPIWRWDGSEIRRRCRICDQEEDE